jgi:hypothetical protein
MRGPDSLNAAVEEGVTALESGVLYVCGLESSVVSGFVTVVSAVEGGDGTTSVF